MPARGHTTPPEEAEPEPPQAADRRTAMARLTPLNQAGEPVFDATFLVPVERIDGVVASESVLWTRAAIADGLDVPSDIVERPWWEWGQVTALNVRDRDNQDVVAVSFVDLHSMAAERTGLAAYVTSQTTEHMRQRLRAGDTVTVTHIMVDIATAPSRRIGLADVAAFTDATVDGVLRLRLSEWRLDALTQTIAALADRFAGQITLTFGVHADEWVASLANSDMATWSPATTIGHAGVLTIPASLGTSGEYYPDPEPDIDTPVVDDSPMRATHWSLDPDTETPQITGPLSNMIHGGIDWCDSMLDELTTVRALVNERIKSVREQKATLMRLRTALRPRGAAIPPPADMDGVGVVTERVTVSVELDTDGMVEELADALTRGISPTAPAPRVRRRRDTTR
jgi:hypothetical protein